MVIEIKELVDHEVSFTFPDSESPFKIVELPSLVSCVNSRPFRGRGRGYWQVVDIKWRRYTTREIKVTIILGRAKVWYTGLYEYSIEPFRFFGRGFVKEWASYLWHGFLRFIRVERDY